ncbi:MAG: xanthine dehydrogenase family protein subunit M [Rubrimonas sp.]|uniref:FAD binding domain-containing protein n=1 Tax=Rubrimonas sp. TaxID=2036015 RepID=UPI002FDE61DD
MYNFDYVKAKSIDDAAAALGREEAYLMSGGQSLVPTLKQRLSQPSLLVDVSGIPEMIGVQAAGGSLTIGGATTHAAVATDPHVRDAIPALAELAGGIGDPQVRNRGTLGGSLAHNDPAACYPAAALALRATIVTNAREIEADDYFQGMFDTALEEGEIIKAVRFPIPHSACYRKFIQPASRFAMAAAFVARTTEGPRVAITGASTSGVFRWTEAEEALAANWSPEAIEPLALDAEDMLGDIHASPAYRAHLAKVMTKRAIADAR